jgi:hypothetical protein
MLLSLLGGWWFYVFGKTMLNLTKGANEDIYPFLGIALGSAAICVVLGRIGVYRIGERLPPISLVGRIMTGRPIVPGFDRVLVAPLLAIFFVVEAPRTFTSWGADPALATASAFALVLLATLTVGPSREAWTLTGHYRILPGIFGKRPPNMV